MTKHQNFKLLPNRMIGVEAISADSSATFGKHTHDQFGVGLMDRGGHQSASGRGTVQAWAGDVITVNPGEVHDGAPIGSAGRSWRMFYFEPSVIAEVAQDITGQASGQTEFASPVIRDKKLALRFGKLFDGATASVSHSLGFDESLLLLLAPLLRRLPAGSADPDGTPKSMHSARAMMDDDPAAALSLADLAQEAGLSRYQFLRRFTVLTGLTPHAYLVQRRVQLARRLIRQGSRPAEAAVAAGFADQSHMTRTFVRTVGLTPGACANPAR